MSWAAKLWDRRSVWDEEWMWFCGSTIWTESQSGKKSGTTARRSPTTNHLLVHLDSLRGGGPDYASCRNIAHNPESTVSRTHAIQEPANKLHFAFVRYASVPLWPNSDCVIKEWQDAGIVRMLVVWSWSLATQIKSLWRMPCLGGSHTWGCFAPPSQRLALFIISKASPLVCLFLARSLQSLVCSVQTWNETHHNNHWQKQFEAFCRSFRCLGVFVEQALAQTSTFLCSFQNKPRDNNGSHSEQAHWPAGNN